MLGSSATTASGAAISVPASASTVSSGAVAATVVLSDATGAAASAAFADSSFLWQPAAATKTRGSASARDLEKVVLDCMCNHLPESRRALQAIRLDHRDPGVRVGARAIRR